MLTQCYNPVTIAIKSKNRCFHDSESAYNHQPNERQELKYQSFNNHGTQDPDILQRSVVGIGRHILNGLNDVHALKHFAEYRVLTVKMGRSTFLVIGFAQCGRYRYLALRGLVEPGLRSIMSSLKRRP